MIAKPKTSEYKTVHAFLKIKKHGDFLDISKKNLKEVFYFEELEHETYPYKPNILKYNGLVFLLSKKLDCPVNFEEGNYTISCSELDILVWSETREGAEEAFAFSFYSLYQNFYLEVDNRLSNEALNLKAQLFELIKTVLNEA